MTSLQPGWFVRKIANPFIAKLGMATTLAVPGRISGTDHTVPVNVLELDGRRYVLSPRGETDWVKNLRAAGTCELRRRGSVERVRVTEEVPVSGRPPLIAAYRSKWDKQVRKLFAELPDPADHPTFAIEPAPVI